MRHALALWHPHTVAPESAPSAGADAPVDMSSASTGLEGASSANIVDVAHESVPSH